MDSNKPLFTKRLSWPDSAYECRVRCPHYQGSQESVRRLVSVSSGKHLVWKTDTPGLKKNEVSAPIFRNPGCSRHLPQEASPLSVWEKPFQRHLITMFFILPLLKIRVPLRMRHFLHPYQCHLEKA